MQSPVYRNKPSLELQRSLEYQITVDDDDSDSASDNEIEKQQSTTCLSTCFSKSSAMGAVFNLIVAIVGAGILSFPFAFKSAGLLWASFLLIICTLFSYVSLNLLTIASTYLELGKGKEISQVNPSYFVLSDHCGGRKLVVFTQINVILSLLGSATSRMIAAKGIIVILYEEYFKKTMDSAEEIEALDVYCMIGLSLIVIFPISLMRDMGSLRFTSLLSVTCSAFLTVCLFAQYFIMCSEGPENTCIWNAISRDSSVFVLDNYSRLFKFEMSGILTAVPLFVFGYNCQANVFPIYKDLKGTEQMSKAVRMKQVFKHSLSISVSLYLVAGSCAFLIFLEDTEQNILLNDFKKSIDITIASIMFTVSMVLAVPCFVNAIRSKVYELFFEKANKKISTFNHVLVTFLIVSFCVLVAVTFKDIAIVMGLFGSTTNPMTGYVLPTYFVWKMTKKDEHKYIKALSVIMVLFVVAVSIGSLYIKICALI